MRQIVLDDEQLSNVRGGLLGDQSDDLISTLFALATVRPVDDQPLEAVQLAERLGWITTSGAPALTKLGLLIADPIREYRFWLDRDRALHSEHEHPMLRRDFYRGKAVLELGSGFGCNLFSLAGLDGRFVGLEPIELYRQFTSILAEREGIVPPEVVGGTAEDLPFEDASFDVVLCYSSHQYMELREAILEVSRVLRPGGMLQIIGGSFTELCDRLMRQVFRLRLRRCRGDALSLINTLSYCSIGRRLFVPNGFFATSAPIYPPVAALERWMNDAGIEMQKDQRKRLSMDTCIIATKRD